MTKHEKITSALSVIAILVAFTNPFISHYWLQKTTIQEFKKRARLQVSSSTDSEQFQRDKIRAIIQQDDLTTVPISFVVQVVNIGELPAKNIEIVVQYNSKAPSEPALSFEPLTQYEKKIMGDQVFVSITRPLAPQDKLRLTIKDYPTRISVTNEFGETSTVDADLGWFRDLKQYPQ